MASKKTKTRSIEGSAVAPEAASRARSAKTNKPAKKTKDAKLRKLSALDAAAKILEESGQPMNCQALIQDMAAKGYWSSPKGKTPASTLYAAMQREIKLKGSQARFQKIDRGLFAYQAPQAS